MSNETVHRARIGVRSKVAASVATFAFAAALLVAGEAAAQVRPAYVKNVDEPGRTPYTMRSQVLPNAGGCFGTSDCANYSDGNGFAIWDLPPVPAGKRWVVLMASGGLINAQGRTATNIELRNNRGGIVFDGLKWTYGGPFANGVSFGAGIFSQTLFTTFEPGEVPTVRLTGSPGLSGYSVIVFEGYLIDAKNN